MTDDADLLRRYAHEGSEDAFTELVHRHIDFVYSAAVRLGRNPARADDIAQQVFTDLARKAKSLCGRRDLLGWLYLCTHNAARAVIRSEVRRARHEREAGLMLPEHPGVDRTPDWAELAPVLDATLRELGDLDRRAILQRFFKNRSFAEVAAALEITEEAAKKRVHRALEKLRPGLARRGVTSTASGLAVVLANQTVIAAPAGLACTISGAALSQATAGGVGTGLAVWLFLMSTSKAIVAGATLAVAIAAYYLRENRSADQPLAASLASAESGHSMDATDVVRVRAGTGEATAEMEPPAVSPTLADILAERDPLRAFALFSSHVMTLRAEEFEPAFARLLWITKPEQQTQFLNLLLKRWGQVEPMAGLAALNALQTQPTASGMWVPARTILLYKNLVLGGWATAQPEEAWDWVVNRSADDLESTLQLLRPANLTFYSSSPEFRGRDPQEAMSDDYRKRRLREVLVALFEAGQFDAASTFLGSTLLLSDDAGAGTLATRMLQRWVAADISAAREWLENHTRPGAIRQGALTGFMQAVAGEDLGIATAFVRNLREPLEIEAASSGVVAVFAARADSNSAYRWLEDSVDENQGGGFDRAIRAYIQLSVRPGVVGPDVEQRLALIARLRDPETRRWALTNLSMGVMDSDPVGAIQVALQFNLPAETWDASVGLPAIMKKWAARDFDQAMAHVNTLPRLSEDEREKLRTIIRAEKTKQ